MTIAVRTPTGKVFTILAEPSDTIESVARKIEEQEGIPLKIIRLIFLGKQLTWGRTLSDYNLEEGCRLDLVLIPSGPTSTTSNVPEESIFPTEEEAEQRILKWQALAEKGGFSADTHIVDPQAHYTMLDSLESRIVLNSQYSQQSGNYRSANPRKADAIRYIQDWPVTPQWISELLAEFETEDDMVSRKIVASLCEMYGVVLGVINAFNYLESKQFCRNFFSVLVERAEGTVAELVRVNREDLGGFKDALEVAITVARNQERADPGDVHEALMQCLISPLEAILEVLGYSQLIYVVTCVSQALDLCRLVVYLLDLGMVSYVGSHASRFDIAYLNLDVDAVSLILGSGLFFNCNRRSLACLSGFLDTKSVWVFQIGEGLPSSSVPIRYKKKLSILTRIDALADVWGPVWAESADSAGSGEDQKIKKYHVSKGCIRRVRSAASSEIPGAVKCHWYSWAQDYVRRFSTLITKTEELPINVEDNLLIGTDLRLNPNCTYTLQEYEMSYGNRMRILGSEPSTWKLDGATVAVQLTAPKVVAFQIQGNVKKVPETTIKQFVMDRWRFEPQRANPGMLNKYFGLEISHCTGNARRVSLKAILLMNPIQELLEQQIPRWASTGWGRAFQKALQTESHSSIFQFWTDHVRERPLVGQLVRSVLDVLDCTGKFETGIRAAFLHQNSELSIDIDEQNNEWVDLLKDSYLTATYAIISDRCLEYRRPDHTTSICNDESRYTILQTQIGLRRGHEIKERLKVEPHVQTYRPVNDERVVKGVPHFLKPETLLKRSILRSHNLALAKELSDQSDCPSSDVTKVVIRATGKSYGGMLYKRDRTLLTTNAGQDSVEQLDCENVAIQEALSELEIGNIMREDIKAQQMGDTGDMIHQSNGPNVY